MSATDLDGILTSAHLVSLLKASQDTQSYFQSLLSSSNEEVPIRPQDQATLLAQLAHLRTLHRQTTVALRATKSETASARSDVDSLHLTLQNLLYEQTHLRTEIEACESYSHPYTDLPLESLEDFLSSHPELSEADAHALTLARIEHERIQREELERQRQALVKKKQALMKENLKRKEDLQGLDGRMEAFIDAARPIEKVLGLVEDDDAKDKDKDRDKDKEREKDDGEDGLSASIHAKDAATG